MGKKKQAQRTKNNVVPASSGRSAELLQSTSGIPFAGFSTLKEGGFIPILTGISDELDLSISEDFRLVWKKMNKKDTTTKLKALDEFKKLCQESEVEALKPVLPYWPRLFSTLTTDEEHRIREAAHAAHRALVSKAGRNIAPYLKQLVGPWFTGQHDTYPPAASTAESAFQETFPPNKLVEVIVFCQYEILNYICNNLLDLTPQSLANNQNCSQEVRDARYQRVVVSSLNGYALYLQRLPVDHLHKAEEANLKLISSAKFWRFNKDPAPIVRAAWFTALVALCEKAPFLLTQEAKHVCMAVFSNIDETDPAVISCVWQAALLTFNVVEDVWKHVSLEKLVLPKLWKVLREGADGNASLAFPNLLPLLSKIPSTLLTDKNNFYSKFFANLRSGLKVRNVQISAKETSAVVTAVLECARYLISTNTEDEGLCLALLEEQVFPLLEATMSDIKLQLARVSMFAGVASLANLWAQQESPLHITLTTCFWRRLSTLCDAALQDHITDYSTLANHCAALDKLLTALKHPNSQSKKGFKVKFVSPRKSTDEGPVETSPSVEESSFSPSFEEARSEFVKGQISLCFDLMKSCSGKARTLLIGHLARILEEYDSEDTYSHILNVVQLTWDRLYRQELACWLRDDTIPLDCTLRVIFCLLRYVQDNDHVQLVYTDLSGEEILAATAEDGETPPEPLYVKWQDILEWALKPEHQTSCVREWVVSHGGVCRLAALLKRHDPSYNILHNCLRNLRQISWLTTEALIELVCSLRRNLTDPSVSEDVKICSGDLLHAMLQNTANHSLLAHLPSEDLRALLLELFTASLQSLKHFPHCWQHCLAVISHTDLCLAAVCETCVDLLVTVVRTSPVDLCGSQKLVSVLEDLVMAAAGSDSNTNKPGDGTDNAANLLAVVLNRLAARLRPDAEAVWSLYTASETVTGALKGHTLPSRQFCSHIPKDPLSAVPLQQYVTNMIPFLVMVVRLHTALDSDGCEAQFPYPQLRAALPAEDLWDWCLQVLRLQSLCVCIKTHFVSTKQYFLLKEKITFILEECGLLSQLRVKDLIKQLNLSFYEEGATSLEQCDALSRLQKEVSLKDLNLLYDVHPIQKDLLQFKSKNNIVKQYYFTEETLEEIAALESLEKRHLVVINSCHRRLLALHKAVETTNISILDRVFDQYVAQVKEDRSLQHLPEEELLHIAEVADFTSYAVEHASDHMKQSSWDACLVAAAALCHSVATTLEEWQAAVEKLPHSPPYPICSGKQTTSKPWPFNLLEESEFTLSKEQEQDKELIRLPLVQVMHSVCGLFKTLSAHLEAINDEDKAAATRRTEWIDVFLPGTHSALTRSWLIASDITCERPTTVLLFEALSSSVARYVQYPHFVISHSDTLGSLDTCCRLLQSSEASVQLAAYQLLLRLIPAMVELDMKQCESDNIALSCQHVDKTLVYTQSIIDVILTGLSFGDLCTVEPFTDSYTYTRSYLLLWCALLELCSQACSQLRALYTTWLKEEYLPVFMKTVFCLMPESAVHGEVTSQRIAQLFSKPPQFDKGVWSSERLAQLSCWVFSCSLRRLPAAIRQWWNEAEHRVYALVEHVTATYVSPDLCADEMRAIQSQEKKFDNMTVHVHPTAKEVYAVYTLEESRMELVIELAHNHPLGLVKVRSGQRMVSTAQTRQWLLQIAILLTHQNGSIWDALELWKNSLDKRFEGVEECYICFAILHSVSHQLPKLSCQTCRKKFHSHCLYKWFTTSNKSTCPICRNLF